jgi:hypothetical protein
MSEDRYQMPEGRSSENMEFGMGKYAGKLGR